MNSLEHRIIDLSFRHKLTHISSCLNVVNTLADIYKQRQEDEPVVLGPSHAALGLFVVLEAHGMCDAEEMIATHGTHASRDMAHGVWCSGGSLGQAETVAVGMALADRSKTVWLITSDGALAEGCVWEALHFAARMELLNLNVHIIANGFAGYCEINITKLELRISSLMYPVFTFVKPKMEWPWLQGLAGHYVQLSQENYEAMMTA